jgi:hypothetical protein
VRPCTRGSFSDEKQRRMEKEGADMTLLRERFQDGPPGILRPSP